MKSVEQTFQEMGYNKLEEKEDLLFFEKWKEDKNQTCITYDKKRNMIKSMDLYMIEKDQFKMESHPHHSPIVRTETRKLKKIMFGS